MAAGHITEYPGQEIVETLPCAAFSHLELAHLRGGSG
jgi:hypothetical protein